MMFRFLLITITLLCVSDTLFGAEAAKVIRLRGQATQLSPGAREARLVELGQKIFEDTSILTKTKSFVVLEFADGARMSVGPDSKVVLTKARGDGPGLVSLLKGKLRSSITPTETNEDKYMIRTRTAAMGVRGTDFQSSYNPENRATSLLTFKGRVAMARLDTPTHELESSAESVNVTRDEKGEPQVEQVKAAKATRVEELQKVLSSKQTVIVENGQYAGAVTGLSRPTEPVVINPSQLQLLYSNDQLAPKKENEVLQKLDFDKIKHQGSADGFYDAKTGRFAPRAGGFVDPDTSLYIPPKEDSVLDTERNVYVPKDVGFINKDTGDYIPPKGLVLDAKNGFVPKTSDGALIAQAGQMNQTMAKDLLLKDIEEEAPILRPNKRERIKLASVWLGLSSGEEVHSVGNDSLGTSFEDTSESSSAFQIGIDMASTEQWQGLARFGHRSVDMTQDGNTTNQASESLWNIGAGARYALSPRTSLSALLSLEQMFIFNRKLDNSVTTNEWSRFTIPTFELTLETEFFRTNRFAMIADLGLILTLPKSKADVDSETSLGLHGRLGAEYWITRTTTLGANFYMRQQKHKLSSTRFTSEDDLSRSGIELRVQYFY